MNLEKFTDRAKGFLQSAQTVAIRMNHQRITPEHVLKAPPTTVSTIGNGMRVATEESKARTATIGGPCHD